MIPQSDTERVLDEFLNSLGVKVERTVELTQFTASDDTVVSTLRHAGGTEEIAETSWLIGCDGAHSNRCLTTKQGDCSEVATWLNFPPLARASLS
jgi:2-polyprenyl-6-methoxyphenol hydroxylase-like FAD-dependent oxidoreductase